MVSPVSLKTVTYTSRARLDLTDEELNRIHEQARHCNALDGITGLLAYDGGRFLQIVEGSEEAVSDLVERLRRDPRHTAFEIRDERFVDRRSFPDWTMELVQVSSGYREARSELSSLLPATTTPAVRELALRMSEELSVGA
jgi:hypothetical protein